MKKFLVDATVLLFMGTAVAVFVLINTLQYAGGNIMWPHSDEEWEAWFNQTSK